MSSFHVISRKASSFDHRDTQCGVPHLGKDEHFIQLGATRKAATFTGDDLSLSYLRRRIERSNFMVRDVEAAPRPPGTLRAERAATGECIAIVDAFSTGASLAYEASLRGYRIVHVLSLEPSDELIAMVPVHLRGSLPWLATLHAATHVPLSVSATTLATELQDICQQHGVRLVCVAPGAETGVKLADALSEAIAAARWAPRVCTNGTALTEARRNKAEMGEAVRNAGVRAVRQLFAERWPPVAEWLDAAWGIDATNDDNECLFIVKPLESAGSDGVTACKTVGDIRRAVSRLVGSINGLGQINEGVLVQEFLLGPEYVVDSVTRDGLHKVVAIWAYDRRPTNGAGFVLHGQALLGSADPVVAPLVAYAKQVLDALHLKHGPAHMEVKLCPPDHGRPDVKTPCLVEVGARCHGAEGFWISIADECCHHNQATAALDAYVDPTKFEVLPLLPPPKLHAAGCIKYLLTYKAGTLEAVDEDALATISGLASYRGHEIFLDIGTPVIPTKDCFSWGGCVKLTHVQPAQCDADYTVIEQLCMEGLWHIV